MRLRPGGENVNSYQTLQISLPPRPGMAYSNVGNESYYETHRFRLEHCPEPLRWRRERPGAWLWFLALLGIRSRPWAWSGMELPGLGLHLQLSCLDLRAASLCLRSACSQCPGCRTGPTAATACVETEHIGSRPLGARSHALPLYARNVLPCRDGLTCRGFAPGGHGRQVRWRSAGLYPQPLKGRGPVTIAAADSNSGSLRAWQNC